MLKNNIAVPAPGPAVSHQPVLRVPHFHVATRTIRGLGLTVAGICFLTIALQLIYPANKSLPSVNFGGYSLGGKTEDEIKKQLSGVDTKTFTSRTDTHAYAQSLGEIGISLETDKIANELANYPITQRLIPFSFFYYKPTTPNNHLIVHDQAKLDAFAAKVAAENNTEPVEGTIINEAGKLTIERSIPGRRYSADTIASYFAAYTNQSLANEADLPFEAVPPVNSFQYLEELANNARTLMEAKHMITYNGSSYEIDTAALKNSVRFVKGGDQKVVTDLDAAILVRGLEAAADGAFQAPVHELDWLPTAQAAVAAIKEGKTAEAILKPLPATGSVLYPATSKGIQSLIEDWQKSHSSIEPVVSFSELGGFGRSASAGGDVRYFSASVYKVFPAWYLLDQIDQGKLDPAGVVAGGMKLDACFYDMIIISQSNCSEAIVNKYGGWSVLDAFIKAKGVEDISLSSGVTVTSNGMTNFLSKLERGELMSAERTKYLLDTMKKQKYRNGFAASGFDVANKVGYQPKTKSWHDAAIMYHPKGTYILVVLTKQGATLPMLSTLAAQINATLSR
jgi:hypothetical protein